MRRRWSEKEEKVRRSEEKCLTPCRFRMSMWPPSASSSSTICRKVVNGELVKVVKR